MSRKRERCELLELHRRLSFERLTSLIDSVEESQKVREGGFTSAT